MPLTAISFTSNEDIRKFITPLLDNGKIKIARKALATHAYVLNLSMIHHEFVVATNNKTYFLGNLLKLSNKEAKSEKIFFPLIKSPSGLEKISLLELREKLNHPIHRLQIYPYLQRDETLFKEFKNFTSQNIDQEKITQIQKRIEKKFRKRKIHTLQKKQLVANIKLLARNYIIATSGETYAVEAIRNLSDDECENSIITFRAKDEAIISLADLKQELQNSDAILYRLIGNIPLFEALLSIDYRAIHHVNFPIHPTFPSCPLQGKGLIVFNPVTTYQENTYSSEALYRYQVEKIFRKKEITHPNTQSILTIEEITPNHALASLVLTHVRELNYAKQLFDIKLKLSKEKLERNEISLEEYNQTYKIAAFIHLKLEDYQTHLKLHTILGNKLTDNGENKHPINYAISRIQQISLNIQRLQQQALEIDKHIITPTHDREAYIQTLRDSRFWTISITHFLDRSKLRVLLPCTALGAMLAFMGLGIVNIAIPFAVPITTTVIFLAFLGELTYQFSSHHIELCTKRITIAELLIEADELKSFVDSLKIELNRLRSLPVFSKNRYLKGFNELLTSVVQDSSLTSEITTASPANYFVQLTDSGLSLFTLPELRTSESSDDDIRFEDSESEPLLSRLGC